MAHIPSVLRILGNAGAVANAQRACEARRRADREIEARLRSLSATTAPTAAAAAVTATAAPQSTPSISRRLRPVAA